MRYRTYANAIDALRYASFWTNDVDLSVVLHNRAERLSSHVHSTFVFTATPYGNVPNRQPTVDA